MGAVVPPGIWLLFDPWPEVGGCGGSCALTGVANARIRRRVAEARSIWIDRFMIPGISINELQLFNKYLLSIYSGGIHNADKVHACMSVHVQDGFGIFGIPCSKDASSKV